MTFFDYSGSEQHPPPWLPSNFPNTFPLPKEDEPKEAERVSSRAEGVSSIVSPRELTYTHTVQVMVIHTGKQQWDSSVISTPHVPGRVKTVEKKGESNTKMLAT